MATGAVNSTAPKAVLKGESLEGHLLSSHGGDDEGFVGRAEEGGAGDGGLEPRRVEDGEEVRGDVADGGEGDFADLVGLDGVELARDGGLDILRGGVDFGGYAGRIEEFLAGERDGSGTADDGLTCCCHGLIFLSLFDGPQGTAAPTVFDGP